MTRRLELQEVELLDEDATEPAAHQDERRRAPRRRWLAGGVVGVVVVLGAVQGVAVLRERAAVAELATVSGVVAPVGETLVADRTISSDDINTMFGYAGGSVEHAADGSQSFTWFDGGPQWTANLAGPSAALADLMSPQIVAGSTCVSDIAPGFGAVDVVPRGDAALVACLVMDGAFVTDSSVDDGGGLRRVPATVRKVIVMSPEDGSVVSTWPLDVGDMISVLPGGIVAVGSGSADGAVLTAFDALTGEVRWSRTDPWLAPFVYSEGELLSTSVFPVGNLLGYIPPDGHLLLLSSGGELVRELGGDGTHVSFSGGGVVIEPFGMVMVQLQDGSKSMFLAPDGDPASDVTVDGQVVYRVLDDGSVPGLLLTSDSALHAWDVRTGTELWSDKRVSPAMVLMMRGRAFVLTNGQIIAYDARTGERLWDAKIETEMRAGLMFTDGRHLLVPFDSLPDAAGPGVVAYDPATGEVAFRTPFPAGIRQVVAAPHDLVWYNPATGEYVLMR